MSVHMCNPEIPCNFHVDSSSSKCQSKPNLLTRSKHLVHLGPHPKHKRMFEHSSITSYCCPDGLRVEVIGRARTEGDLRRKVFWPEVDGAESALRCVKRS